MNLSAQAYLHANGRTYPMNSLFNALCAAQHPVNRFTALIDSDGRSYQSDEIDEALRSPEFAAYRDRLTAEGKTRD